MASPIEDSAAATVKINKVNIWPIISSKNTENKIKLKFTDNKSNSILIKITIKFLFNKKIPNKLIKNNTIEINKNLKSSKFIIIFFSFFNNRFFLIKARLFLMLNRKYN